MVVLLLFTSSGRSGLIGYLELAVIYFSRKKKQIRNQQIKLNKSLLFSLTKFSLAFPLLYKLIVSLISSFEQILPYSVKLPAFDPSTELLLLLLQLEFLITLLLVLLWEDDTSKGESTDALDRFLKDLAVIEFEVSFDELLLLSFLSESWALRVAFPLLIP